LNSNHPTILVCKEDNDLYRVLVQSGYPCERFPTFGEALQKAPEESALLALADDYPRPCHNVCTDMLTEAKRKNLRLYIEYPETLPGYTIGRPQPTKWERMVVSSNFFAPRLAMHTILVQHGCWFLPLHAEEPLLAAARVAGYRKAVFELPAEASPILFMLSDEVMVATSKLSQFVTGRYAPKHAWKAIWEKLLSWLIQSSSVPALCWSSTVRPSFDPEEQLPADIEKESFRRSVNWFSNHVIWSVDQKKGAIEGYESGIDHKGRQKPRVWCRGDCMAESAMVMAHAWAVTSDPSYHQLASQMLDTVWLGSDFFQADPDSPAYGHINWYERGPIFYGDDNARVILPTLMAARLLDEDRWNERVLRCLLANLRTTGRLGFRRNRIDLHQFPTDSQGWRSFYDEEIVSYWPHYQAYLWAANIWAYSLTKFDGFLERTKAAIRMTMDAYPKWRWTNGFTQESARMLLPLAFLVRVEDTAQHRQWLRLVADDLLENMQPCGAIREQTGPAETGSYPPPKSNETYGTNEAPVIQENGDPACDLLYTTNYAFLGLHEAAAATGDTTLKEAAAKLAQFLVRIQVHSETHPYLDGAWMRSFDYELWEYWGSSADLGWGAWCVESGWTNAWIAAVLAMRARGDTLFSTETADRLDPLFSALVEEMMPPTHD
jgi:hypothetical protein